MAAPHKTQNKEGVAPSARQLDEFAVEATLRRLARQPQPPWLHTEVARRMVERLAAIKLQPATVLDWWGYTGASADCLSQAYPNTRRIVVEPCEALMRRSLDSSRRAWWPPRRWIRPSIEVTCSEPASASAQLLWANMMLHAEPDPLALMTRWQRLLSVEGFVMFSCFGPDTVRELRALYHRLGWPAAGVEFVDMHDLGDMLVQAGFADPVMDQEHVHLTWDNPPALLAELRGMGSNVSPARWPGLRTPRWRDGLCQELSSLADAKGRLSLSFEIIYGHAFNAKPPQRRTSETTVPLEDVRTMVRAAAVR